jgi:hypothetical protein
MIKARPATRNVGPSAASPAGRRGAADSGQSTPAELGRAVQGYEIIEYTGILREAMNRVGIPVKMASTFARTACHPVAAGPDARYGRLRQEPRRTRGRSPN